MSMRTCRRLAAWFAFFTILCGGSCKLLKELPEGILLLLSACAILFAVAAVFIVIRFHRCPNCGRFIPITLRPAQCPHCGIEI
ncbi:hypothetical protein [Mediterraneibacter massiliensis]|jgi:hypothetical protein|uniref:hypothetical protein n=1 Tax=Mediterraneibacter massiliensis TaxID=1720300 RepID=UPI0011C15ECC|nr:hypothetical protein [Mediterraneibacter massiliensis]